MDGNTVSLYASESMNAGDMVYINDRTGMLVVGDRDRSDPVLLAPIDIEPGDLVTFDPINGHVLCIVREGKIIWAKDE